jgi:hypothetical protein
MKTLVLSLITILSINSYASIVCHTPRMNKQFEIKENKISFFKEENELKNREIASLVSRNKSELKGLTKIVDFENQKHTIHIEDKNNFSDVNDYLVIRNKSGHEIIYPISCNNK